MNKSLMIDALRIVKQVFEQYNVTFWLDFGTALGFYRDGDFLKADPDVDLSIHVKDTEKFFNSLEALKTKLDFTLAGPVNLTDGVIQLHLGKVSSRYDNVIDISLWRFVNDRFISLIPRRLSQDTVWFHFLRVMKHHLSCSLELPNDKLYSLTRFGKALSFLPYRLRFFLIQILNRFYIGFINWLEFTPKKYYNRLGRMTFANMTFNVPSCLEEYLLYNYGPLWVIDRPNYNWVKDQKADLWLINDRSSYLYEVSLCLR